MCKFPFLSVCSGTCYSISDPLVRSEPGNRRPRPDSDSCSLWTRYTGDLETSPWDDLDIRTGSCSGDQTAIDSKITSFHVSVCSYVFIYLLLLVCVYVLLLSFHMTFCYILQLWLLVSLHETSIISYLIYVVDMSIYQRHFMCWYLIDVGLGLVLKHLRL